MRRGNNGSRASYIIQCATWCLSGKKLLTMKKDYNHFVRRGIILASILTILVSVRQLSGQVSLSEQAWILPTYKVNPPDKNPMFFKGEGYQGASRYVYPLALLDNLSNEKSDHAWKALKLTNEFIELCIMPEIGGKLWYGTDKTNGYNFIYKNNVVRPSNIGMTGAWVSGGIEWCVLHHHRASTFLPVDYELKDNKDGSKTVWIGETEPRHGIRWTIGITVFPGKSYFEAEVKIHNQTPFTHTFLYWANVAAHTNENYQVIFPPSVQYATYHAKNAFIHWPVAEESYRGQEFTKGKDMSWWKNSPVSNSFFAHDLKEDFMGGYDYGRETGTVHIGDHNIIKGAKLWEWGSGERGQATEARLTENDGPYVEIMVGAFSDNQPDYSWIKPYEVKSFKQYWYPVKDIGGFKYANLNGAVNLELREKNTLFLGYYSTQRVNKAKILLKNSGKIIFEKELEISPAVTFAEQIKLKETFKFTNLFTELVNAETGEVLISYQPVEKKYDAGLPETVEQPALPEDIKTIEELYLTGSRIEQFYNTSLNAMDYFTEALKRDPGDIRSNTAIGNIYLKNGNYQLARKHFAVAVRRLTKDYTRPSGCEALYLQGLTLKALELYDEAIDTLYRASWDNAFHSASFLELARISVIKGDLVRALGQINESLKTNAVNNSAINLKASVLRKMGFPEEAKAVLAAIFDSDPLDFRAGNERYLLTKNGGDVKTAEMELAVLNKKMRDFERNFLELAVGYLNDGMPDEAEEVLLRFGEKNPEISYYLGYINDRKGNKPDAQKFFKEGSSLPVDYCFPYRLESVKVFNLASEYNKDDPKPFYYLGNLLYDKQPQKAIECWEKAVKLDPSFAIAFRNLGWAYYNTNHDVPSAITAYENAVRNKNDDPVYYAELDPLYELNNTPVEIRAKLFAGSNDIAKKRDDSFIRQILVYVLSDQPEKALEYLNNRYFGYREGSSRVADVTVDAYLMLGKKYYSQKNYNKALEQFTASLNTFVGEENNRRIPQINYFIGTAYEALGNKAKAKSYFTKSVEQAVRSSGYVSYYQGLSWHKLGNSAKASEVFNSLIAEGERRIRQGSEQDFFATFREREGKNSQLSDAYMLKGLGYKGLGQNELAFENLKKSVEYSNSNLWGGSELSDLK
jgi:tetratricopeptide (TPR) repeat protein